MTIDAIKEARDAAPFKPFIIRTADGYAFEVPNHDSLLVAEKGETIIVRRGTVAAQRAHLELRVDSPDLDHRAVHNQTWVGIIAENESARADLPKVTRFRHEAGIHSAIRQLARVPAGPGRLHQANS